MHTTGLSGLYGSSYTSRTSSIHAINLASSFFFGGDAPVVVFVRSKFVFFNALRIASRLTGVSRTIFDFSSSSRRASDTEKKEIGDTITMTRFIWR